MTAYLPPVHSPVGLGDIGAAAVRTVSGRGSTAEALLRGLLLERFGAEEAVLCDSGTHALELAIRTGMALRAGGSGRSVVALPAYGCFDLATAVVGAGARVVFYDLEPETLSPLISSVDEALSQGTEVVVAAHLYGIPIRWDEIEALTKARGAVLIEDAAQGAGATWGGHAVGGLGSMAILSFGRGKGWMGGGGGALLLRGEAVAAARELQIDLAASRASAGVGIVLKTLIQWLLGRPGLYGIPARIPMLGLGETTYHAPSPLATMSTFSSHLAARTAAGAFAEADRRLAFAQALEAGLADLDAAPNDRPLPIRVGTGGRAGYLRLPVLIGGGIDALAGGAAGARRLGIMPGYPSPIPDLPALERRRAGGEAEFPGASRLVRSLVTLPTHRFVSPRHRGAILAAFTPGD